MVFAGHLGADIVFGGPRGTDGVFDAAVKTVAVFAAATILRSFLNVTFFSFNVFKTLIMHTAIT